MHPASGPTYVDCVKQERKFLMREPGLNADNMHAFRKNKATEQPVAFSFQPRKTYED